jgi:hypothetical protein
MPSRRTIVDEILRLDPQRDHQRIVLLTTAYEFPYDIARALELALFRTFAVPSISSLLDRTGEFRQRPQKRYDDTAIILGEMPSTVATATAVTRRPASPELHPLSFHDHQ